MASYGGGREGEVMSGRKTLVEKKEKQSFFVKKKTMKKREREETREEKEPVQTLSPRPHSNRQHKLLILSKLILSLKPLRSLKSKLPHKLSSLTIIRSMIIRPPPFLPLLLLQ